MESPPRAKALRHTGWWQRWGRMYRRSSVRGWATFYASLIWYWIFIYPVRNRFRLRGRPRWVRSGFSRFPLVWRPGTSDLFMFKQIFAEREYSCLDGLTIAGLIVDCGANVGYSSAYFLSRFPEARVVAIEPDPGNFEILKRNLAPFGDRVTWKQTGIWSHPCGLVLTGDFRAFQECSRQVREAGPGETPQFHATDIATVLAETGAERISILKIDIERSEKELFARNYDDWLSRTDHLLIELHDRESRAVFEAAIAKYSFHVIEYGELTVCVRRR
jgi:FkbM family methyltransferase